MQELLAGRAVHRDPLLRIEQLHVSFTERQGTVLAVRGVSLEIGVGDSLGVVGESGCGKTVTALAILGLLSLNAKVSGGVWLGELNLATAPEKAMRKVRGHQIGMVFQDPLASLNPVMTVGAQIDEVLAAHLDLTHRERLTRAIELLRMVEIPNPAARLRAYPHELSGGMRQRVMIAMALACRPQLLIADEPTTALDVTVQAQLLDTLARLRLELGMALMLVSHDLGVVARACRRVAVMYGGRIIETGPMQQVLTGPQHPYTAALLAAQPKLSGPTRTGLRSISGMPPRLREDITACSFAPRCPRAAARCSEQDPALESTNPERAVACFFPSPSEPV